MRRSALFSVQRDWNSFSLGLPAIQVREVSERVRVVQRIVDCYLDVQMPGIGSAPVFGGVHLAARRVSVFVDPHILALEAHRIDYEGIALPPADLVPQN